MRVLWCRVGCHATEYIIVKISLFPLLNLHLQSGNDKYHYVFIFWPFQFPVSRFQSEIIIIIIADCEKWERDTLHVFKYTMRLLNYYSIYFNYIDSEAIQYDCT